MVRSEQRSPIDGRMLIDDVTQGCSVAWDPDDHRSGRFCGPVQYARSQTATFVRNRHSCTPHHRRLRDLDPSMGSRAQEQRCTSLWRIQQILAAGRLWEELASSGR